MTTFYGLTIPIRAYVPRDRGPFPGVVFCHGNRAIGMDHPMYVRLCEKLAYEGFLTLSYDNLCYNRAWHPKELKCPEDFDFRWACFRSITELVSMGDCKRGKVHIIGHSMGGAVALAVGAVDKRVGKIIALSPAEVQKSISTEERREKYRLRLQEEMGIPVSNNIVLPIRQAIRIDNYLVELKHKDVLVAFGSLEPKDEFIDRQGYDRYLDNVVREMNPRKAKLLRLNGVGHFYGIESCSARNAAFDELLREVITFLKEN